MREPLENVCVLGMRIDGTSYRDAAERILGWAARGESRTVCCANVHMVMEGHDDPAFRELVNRADLVTPDGMPLVWYLRASGLADQRRVYGPELVEEICARAAEAGVPVAFYGGSEEAIRGLQELLPRRFPGLRIACAISPPFRQLSAEEERENLQRLREAGAPILFVGLGCPKQERWMAEHVAELPAVLLGVGAAFDFLSGTKAQAPRFVRQSGFEWLFRLATEPRRLWKRFARHNPRFVALALRELLSERRAPRSPPGSSSRRS